MNNQKEFSMWYVAVLALSACSNCWAMNELIKVDVSTKDIQRESKPGEINEFSLRCYGYSSAKQEEKWIQADGYLYIGKEYTGPFNAYERASEAARAYHLKMAQYYRELRDACEEKEPAYKQYAEKRACHAALLKYLHEDQETYKITFARGANERYCPCRWLYTFENSLVAIKSDTLENAKFLSLPNKSDRFTAFSINDCYAFAADNTGKVHSLDTHNGRVYQPCQLPDVCKKVTAMHQVDGDSALAIFYRDEKDNKKAGFLLRKNGYGFTFSVVPLAEGIQAITWMNGEENKVCGSIIGGEFPRYRLIAKYILHHWNYPDPDQYIEYILPKPNDSKDNE